MVVGKSVVYSFVGLDCRSVDQIKTKKKCW